MEPTSPNHIWHHMVIKAAELTVLRLMAGEDELIEYHRPTDTYRLYGAEMNPETAKAILYGHMPAWVRVNVAGADTVSFQITPYGRHVAKIAKEPVYVVQGHDDMCCFVYAAANLLIHEGKPCPIVDDRIKQRASCDTGATIDQERVLEVFKPGLQMHQTNTAKEVFERGGIFAILHPLWNIHAVAIAPVDSIPNRVWAINSFLGPHLSLMPTEYLETYEYTGGAHWVRE